MKEYTVIIGGQPHTLLLTEEDAQRVGAVEVKAVQPANKARAPQNKAGGK